MSKPRVIVTRPPQEAGAWVTALADAGYRAVALPLIEVAPAVHGQALLDAWARLHTFDAVMFVSGNAVDFFFASKPLEAGAFTAQAATKIRAYVTGPGSYAALQRVQMPAHCIDVPDLEAGVFDSEALWAVVKDQLRAGFRLLIVRGSGGAGGLGGAGATGSEGQGRDWFATQAQCAGASVEFVVAYQRLCPALSAGQLAMAQVGAVDGSVWLFSSSEAIANLVHLCPGQTWAKAKAVVTHPRIGQVARQAGFVVYESRPSLNALIASIESTQ